MIALTRDRQNNAHWRIADNMRGGIKGVNISPDAGVMDTQSTTAIVIGRLLSTYGAGGFALNLAKR